MLTAAVAHVNGKLRVRTYCARCGELLTDDPSLTVDAAGYTAWLGGELHVRAEKTG